VADAFQMAFTVPNLFRRLLGEGALSAAFIPIFKEKERHEGEVEMWRSANAVISGLVAAAALVIGVVLLGTTLVLSQVPLGENTRLMLSLLRVMFPYMLLVCIAAALIGMLNARGHFFVPALGAAMLNVVMIASVLLLAPRMGDTLETRVFGLAIGVLVAGLAQAGFQVPSLRREGYRYRWVRPWPNDTVREVVRKMLPASIGVAAFQINVLLTQVIAFGTQESIVASFNFAVRLMEFPQGLIGVSLATYLLPTLSGLAADRRYPEFRSTLRQGLGYLLYANLLAAGLLVALATPMVRLLFQYGMFNSHSTSKVAMALACLGPGLVAFSTVNILARAFYALGDTRTPMRISVFCLATNLLVVLWLVGQLEAAGLALANTATSFLNVGLLLYALRRKLGQLHLRELAAQSRTCLLAAVAASLMAYGLNALYESHLGHASVPHRIGAVFGPALVAALAYFGATRWGRVPAARDISSFLLRTPNPDRN
jgi:putative peptidoglycan lipid II flippase